MLKDKLLALIKTGEIDDIETILTENIDAATLVLDGHRTLIHYAAGHGYLKLIQFLLEKKSDLLNLADGLGQTPVFWASVNGHTDIVKYLAVMGADLNLVSTKNTSGYHGYAPIHWAVKRGHQTVAQALIDHGADINIRAGGIQFHSIHLAAMHGRLEIVKILLNKNHQLLDITDKHGQTPLLLAAANGHTDTLEYLISKSADLNQATNLPGNECHGKTALHWATKQGHIDAVRHLIKAGATITTLNGKHPIHIAAENGHLNLVKLYLDDNPKLLYLTDPYGQTPLLWAATKGHTDTLEYLISKGADLNQATNFPDDEGHGKTALHWATERGHTNAVGLLIQAGAAITTLNGIHPIHIAAAHGHTDTLDYLISEGADLNQATNRPGHKSHGKTALDYAMKNSYYDTANLLILKITAHQSKKAILPFIKSGTQALELMTREPTMLGMLLKDQRIMELIHTKTRRSITGNYIDWYKPSDRRPSWFAHINTETKTSSVFKPVKASRVSLPRERFRDIQVPEINSLT